MLISLRISSVFKKEAWNKGKGCKKLLELFKNRQQHQVDVFVEKVLFETRQMQNLANKIKSECQTSMG